MKQRKRLCRIKEEERRLLLFQDHRHFQNSQCFQGPEQKRALQRERLQGSGGRSGLREKTTSLQLLKQQLNSELDLTEQDYLSFQESLENERDEDDGLEKKRLMVTDAWKSKNDAEDKEVRVGIMDWWTKSKYAYLNQPAVASMEPPKIKKRASSYIPNSLSYKPKPLYPTSIGVF